MAEQLRWLSLRASNLKFSFLCSNFNWVLLQNIFVTKFSAPSLPRQSVLSDPLTDLTFLFPVLGSQSRSRSFVCIGPSLWNRLPPSLRSTILSSSISTSFSHLKTFLFPRSTSHWELF